MARDDLAGRLVVGLSGPVPTAAERAWLAAHRPCGVILFSRNCRNYSQLSLLCQDLRELVPGVEISADHEGGPVSQLAAALGRPPVAWTLGTLDDVPLTARVHAETARRLAAAGVDRVLAPVADVLVEPRNPVIGSRSFGATESLVTRHVVAAVTGLIDGGVGVCLKHWPGHGASRTDTHREESAAGTGALPGPFMAGLDAGADAVMVGHVVAPGAGLPATLDADHLASARRALGRDGIRPSWYADDVTMGALRGAMADRGLTVPGDPGTGLLDPAVLPRDWFAALADAGCDRLLVRGLPLAAFALPAATPGAGEAAPPGGQPDTPVFDDGPYDEARRRAWSVAGTDFAAPAESLLWWDLSAGDRWEVAGGDRGSARDLLGPVLAGRFARVVDATGEAGEGGEFGRLLVTSHRPLDDLPGRDHRLAERGRCLVLGHPSLADDLAAYLGAGWRVGSLGDIAPEDLFRAS